MKKILFVEDDLRLRKSLVLDFQDRGYQTFEAASISEIPETEKFDYAVIDLRLPGESGLDALKKVLNHNPLCRAVVLTGYGSIATAVEGIKRGAHNYLTKPISAELLEETLVSDRTPDQTSLETPVTPLSRHEHEYIEFVLNRNNGNISKTAKELGLHRQSLQRKLKKYP